MPLYGYYFDPTYVLVIIAFLLTLFASLGVKSTFNKYDKIGNARGLTGADVARMILDSNGLSSIPVQRVQGELTDHFDPKANVIRLSDSTYASNSVAALGVAAHECGHAIQHAENYAPIMIRNTILPIVNIGNTLSMPLFILGLILGMTNLALIGALLFGLVLVFQLVTLPVELNASRRAMNILESRGILGTEELKGSKKVLTAAAMTYVAAVAASALQLLRLLLIVSGRRRD